MRPRVPALEGGHATSADGSGEHRLAVMRVSRGSSPSGPQSIADLSAELPELVRVRQVLNPPRLRFPTADLQLELRQHDLAARIPAGGRVAITAGSRGIAELVGILRCISDAVRSAGGKPFLVPCMGSHGGATAEGQTEVLEGLGITEATVGAPIVSSMDVLEIGRSSLGAPVYVARDLMSADSIVVVNRIKPHTDFPGPFGSGIAKMLVIGMGKQRGALEAHRLTIRHGYANVLRESAKTVMARLPVAFGVGIIENQHDQIAELHVLSPETMLEVELALFRRSRELMPSLPFDRFDCLVVDELGKEISGAGMDTNVIGRANFCAGRPPERPRITRIVVLDLTLASHGNAIGIGMADYTTTRLLSRVDAKATAINSITSMTPEDGRLPIACDTDVEAVHAAYVTSGAASKEDFSLVWIRNTLALDEMLVSSALIDEVRAHPLLEVIEGPLSFPVADDGSLVASWGSRTT